VPEPANVVARVPLTQRLAGAVMAFLDPKIYAAAVRADKAGGDRPFPAGDPLPPLMGEGTPARAHVPPTFGNLVTSPRRYQGRDLTPFEQMRALSSFDLVQIALQDCRGQILGMEWALEPARGVDEVDPAEEERAQLWLEQPDPLGRKDFSSWLGSIVDEIYTTDALTLLPRRTLGGEPIGLEQVDGATIVPLVDDRGRSPLAPAPAYQQIVHGMPETEFTLDELWYLPRNQRIDSPYGRSNVEQVLWTINLAMRRYTDDLAYYTHGNLSDALYQCPPDWSQTQIADLQKYFDDLISGRSDRKAGSMRFVPGGDGATFVATHTREWKPEFNEYLARVICYAFQVSPLPLVRMMNRGTAEQAEVAGTEGGVRPVAAFCAAVINRYLRVELGLRSLVFRWQDDEVEDPAVVYQRNIGYTHGGAMTYAELRDELGLEPYDGDWAKRPMVVTAAGAAIFLDEIEEQMERQREQQDAFRAALGGGAPGEDPDQAGGGDDGAPGAGRDGGAARPPGDGAPQASTFERRAKSIRSELEKWRRATLKRVREGKPLRKFESSLIPPEIRRRVEEALGL